MQISTHSQILIKIVALKNFANFTGNYICRSLFLISFQAFRHPFYRAPPMAASEYRSRKNCILAYFMQ